MQRSEKKFSVSEYEYVTPTVTSDDPRMLRAIDGWLGLYEACYVMALGIQEGLVVADGQENYGIESAQRPRPEHLLAALTQSAQALNQWNGHWVLGGGLAMNFYGRERATRDVDFFLETDKDQLDPVFAALKQHGVFLHSYEKPSFMPPDAEHWWVPLQFGLPDAAPVDVDLLVAPSEFQAFLHASGVESRLNGTRIRIVGLEALMILKMKAYRGRDQDDLQALLRAHKSYDRELVLAWLQKFKIEHRLAEIEALANENGGRRMG